MMKLPEDKKSRQRISKAVTVLAKLTPESRKRVIAKLRAKVQQMAKPSKVT